MLEDWANMFMVDIPSQGKGLMFLHLCWLAASHRLDWTLQTRPPRSFDLSGHRRLEPRGLAFQLFYVMFECKPGNVKP